MANKKSHMSTLLSALTTESSGTKHHQSQERHLLWQFSLYLTGRRTTGRLLSWDVKIIPIKSLLLIRRIIQPEWWQCVMKDIANMTSNIAVLFQITIKMSGKLEENPGGSPLSPSADVMKIRAEHSIIIFSSRYQILYIPWLLIIKPDIRPLPGCVQSSRLSLSICNL